MRNLRRLRLLLSCLALLQVPVFSWGIRRGPMFMLTARHEPNSSQRKSQILLDSGKSATVRSRTLSIGLAPDWNITVWEWDKPTGIIEHYWNVQQGFVSRKDILDPFGLVSWPGSVVAARELFQHQTAIQNSTVLVLGAGPGVEAQALAMLGAKRVISTDIHPTTLVLLKYGAQQAGLDGLIEAFVFDICSDEPLPECDIVVAADVLYNDHLASHVGKRCLEALRRGRKLLVSDSQRFTDFVPELNNHLETPVAWEERRLQDFTGSGVMVEEDQTYNVTARVLAVGW